MTYQPPIRSYAGAAPTIEHDTRPHRCGRCNNSTGVLNKECPNNTDPVPPTLDEELERLIRESRS